VHPAQTMYQTSVIAGAPMESDFDYDCDTVEEPGLPTEIGTCFRASSWVCRVMSPGWVGTIPECGEMGMWLSNCALGGGTCVPVAAARTQSCL